MDREKVYSSAIRGWFTAKMAAHGILSKPLRSALTILGVAIGVASVVSLMGIGEGARKAVVEQFESLGSNVVVVKAHNENYYFDPSDSQELVERVNGLELASPIVQTETLMKWRRTRGKIDVIGTNEDFLKIRDNEMFWGHFFGNIHVENRCSVAVVGYTMGTSLLGGRNPVGRSINLNGQSYRIIGVLKEKGKGKAEDIDNKIIIPYTAALKIADTRRVSEIWGKASSETDADLAVVQLSRIYKKKLGINQKSSKSSSSSGDEVKGDMPVEDMGGEMDMDMDMNMEMDAPPSNKPVMKGTGEDVITITSLNQMVEEADKANRIMTLLLGGIAAVSLLVGGLGIMNIMLVAVTERTEEIGVRRALGAKRGDLLFQFILEALYVSIIGTIAGIVIGLIGMNIFENYGFQTAVSFQSIRIATVVAMMSGLLFGVYPAVSASSVPPVEALRRQ